MLKELLRRFKPDNVVVSDCGVKEGYMTLVATGEEKGVPINLDGGAPTAETVAQTVASSKPKTRSKSKKA